MRVLSRASMLYSRSSRRFSTTRASDAGPAPCWEIETLSVAPSFTGIDSLTSPSMHSEKSITNRGGPASLKLVKFDGRSV